MKNSPVVILFLILAFASCKKSNYANPLAVAVFSKQALKYVQLPLNRYFIYKDSASGVNDSVVVTKSDLYMDPHPPRSTGSSSSGYGSSTFSLDSEQVYKLTLTNPVGKIKWYDVEARAGFIFAVIDSAAPLAFCGTDNLLPATVDRNSNCLYGFAYLFIGVSTSLSSLSVDGNTYNDVLQIISTNGGEQNATEPWYFKSTYYWAKNIGIIKRTVKTNAAISTCALVRYGQ